MEFNSFNFLNIFSKINLKLERGGLGTPISINWKVEKFYLIWNFLKYPKGTPHIHTAIGRNRIGRKIKFCLIMILLFSFDTFWGSISLELKNKELI